MGTTFSRQKAESSERIVSSERQVASRRDVGLSFSPGVNQVNIGPRKVRSNRFNGFPRRAIADRKPLERLSKIR